MFLFAHFGMSNPWYMNTAGTRVCTTLRWMCAVIHEAGMSGPNNVFAWCDLAHHLGVDADTAPPLHPNTPTINNAIFNLFRDASDAGAAVALGSPACAAAPDSYIHLAHPCTWQWDRGARAEALSAFYGGLPHNPSRAFQDLEEEERQAQQRAVCPCCA